MRPGVGVGVFVKKDNQVLVYRRVGAHEAGTWGLPGGHMEFGETPEQTAIRESKEEANVNIRNPRVVGITNDFMPAESKHYVTIFVEAEYAGGDLRNNDSSVSEFQWCALDKLPSPLFTPLKNFIERRRLL